MESARARRRRISSARSRRPCRLPDLFDQRPASGKPVEIRREDSFILVLDGDLKPLPEKCLAKRSG
jgi:hypothetical protein